MTQTPQRPDSENKFSPYILPLFALVVIAGGTGLALLSRPQVIRSASLGTTPAPPSYQEALKQAEQEDTQAKSSVKTAMTAPTKEEGTVPVLPRTVTRTHASAVAKAPVVLAWMKPVYPLMAKQNRIEGPVEVSLKVDRHGLPSNVEALSGNPALRKAALEAAEQWRFRPASAPGDFRIRFDFKLS